MGKIKRLQLVIGIIPLPVVALIKINFLYLIV